MKKKGLIAKANEVLKENDVTKPINVSSYSLYVMDDDGNKKRFNVPIPTRRVHYNQTDVLNILDALIAAIADCIRRGEELNIYGVLRIGVKYRKPYMVKMPGTDEYVEVPGAYTPYAKFGNIFKTAARLYGANVDESSIDLPDPIYDDDDELFVSQYEDDEENS